MWRIRKRAIFDPRPRPDCLQGPYRWGGQIHNSAFRPPLNRASGSEMHPRLAGYAAKSVSGSSYRVGANRGGRLARQRKPGSFESPRAW